MADLYDLGERPPLGLVPKQMHAYAVRQNRFGPPRDAWKREVIPTPAIGPDEVLIYVMASGINFNNVWAALGAAARRHRASARSWASPRTSTRAAATARASSGRPGKDVKNVEVGDEVIVHSGWWRPDDPVGARGQGSDAGREHAHLGLPDQLRQLLPVRPRPGAPVPAQAASASPGRRPGASCSAPRRRTGCSWAGRRIRVEPGDVVLVWGAAGGLGSMALDITRAQGGRAVAVVSDEAKREFCLEARRGRGHQPQQLQALGTDARHRGRRGVRRVGQGRPRLRQGHLGRARRADQPAHRVRASGRGDPCRPRASSARPAG